ARSAPAAACVRSGCSRAARKRLKYQEKPCDAKTEPVESALPKKTGQRADDHAGDGESASREAVAAGRERHRLARSADRAADRAHQRIDRALQDARQGFPFAARAAEARQPAAQAARLSEAHGC